MIIGVDAGCLGISDERLQGGVYQVATNLFKALSKIDTQNTYYLYSFIKIERKLLIEFGPNVKNVIVKPVRGWTKIWLPLQLLKDKPDIFIGMNQSLPLKLPLQTYKSVVIVHDLLFEDHHDWYVGTYRKMHQESKSAALTANSIMTVSDAVKKDLIRKYNVTEDKITVAYEGIREFPESTNKFKKINSFFLFVGALKKSKNIPRIIEAFSKFSKKIVKPYELYIVGSDKWLDADIQKTMAKQSKYIQERIHIERFVSDKRLADLYTHAKAFVSPSIYEGFGLPFVEAMHYGLPIIGSKTGPVPEVVGDAGMLVDPYNVEDIARAMTKVVQDNKLYSKLQKNALERAKMFTWEHFANTLYSIILSYEHKTTQ